MNKKQILLLFFILLGAVFTRLYHFNFAMLDWHSWRQVDTSSVSRNFVEKGFNILHPTFHDYSKGVSLLDNPNGYRFVEFPIYNIIQAGLFSLFNFFTLEEWGRVVSIVSSVGAIIFIYFIVRKYLSSHAAFWSAFFYAFAPYSIYYGRTVLPDQMMVACMLGGFYFLDKALEKKPSQWGNFLLGTLFTSAAILLKPFVLFFFISFVYLFFWKQGLSFLKKKEFWIFLIITVAPFIAWRIWMLQYPEGIPQSNWLFNGNGVRFKGAFLRWIFADRIAYLILGYFGLPIFILGVIGKIKKEGLFFLSLAVSSLVYVNVIATGNTQHDYYQLLIFPTIAIFFGKGVEIVFAGSKEVFNRMVAIPVVLACIIMMLALSWFRVRDLFTVWHYEVLEVGEIINTIAPKDAKVIAPLGGDTTFLYYTKRNGWPVVDRPFYEFVDNGAKYIAFVNPKEDELNLKELFTPVRQGINYVIYDLTKPTEKGKVSMDTERKKDKGGK